MGVCETGNEQVELAKGAAGDGGKGLRDSAAPSPVLAPAWPQPLVLLCSAGRHRTRMGLTLVTASTSHGAAKSFGRGVQDHRILMEWFGLMGP